MSKLRSFSSVETPYTSRIPSEQRERERERERALRVPKRMLNGK